jgi:hypothetical protein
MRTIIGIPVMRPQLLPGPPKLGAIHPHAMHDDRQSSRDSNAPGSVLDHDRLVPFLGPPGPPVIGRLEHDVERCILRIR